MQNPNTPNPEKNWKMQAGTPCKGIRVPRRCKATEVLNDLLGRVKASTRQKRGRARTLRNLARVAAAREGASFAESSLRQTQR